MSITSSTPPSGDYTALTRVVIANHWILSYGEMVPGPHEPFGVDIAKNASVGSTRAQALRANESVKVPPPS